MAKDPTLCTMHGCRKKRGKKLNKCYMHVRRIEKERDPLGYTFRVHKNNAKRRGHEHSITLEEFKVLVEESGYMKKKGVTAKSLSLDRIDPKKGYVTGNIRVITVSQNSKKAYADFMAEYGSSFTPAEDFWEKKDDDAEFKNESSVVVKDQDNKDYF